MKQTEIKPHKITKPIQLLAAWLAGLILIDSCFLAGGIKLGSENWLQQLLVIASVVNVPLFLLAIFLLQTKFRPEMQEDAFYSQYLDKKTNKLVEINDKIQIKEPNKQIKNIATPLSTDANHDDSKNISVSVNDHLPNYLSIKSWLVKNNYTNIHYIGRNIGTENPPTLKKISVYEFSNLELIKPIIKTCPEFGIDYIDIYKHIFPEDTDDVIIGSYGGAIIKITKSFLEKLELFDMIDLVHHCRINKE